MKNSNHLVLILALTAVAGFVALAVWGVPPGGESPKTEITTSTFHVTGMTCGGCEVGVRRVVKKLDGVEEVEASYKEETAVITYQPEKVTPAQIIEAIQSLGYSAELQEEEGAAA